MTTLRVGPRPPVPAILLAEQLVGLDRESLVRIVLEQDARGHLVAALELHARAAGAYEQQRSAHRFVTRWPPAQVRIPLTTLALQELAHALDRVARAAGVRR